MMRAISTFIFELGISTTECRAELALRTRVSMSAMGSVIDMVLASLPAGLGQAGDDALMGELAQTDTTDAELTVVGPRSSAPGAPMVLARRKALLATGLHHEGCLRHTSDTPSLTGTACPAWPAGRAPLRLSWRSQHRDHDDRQDRR